MEKLAPDRAANGQIMEFTLLKDSDPGLERSAPAPGDCGRHIEGFAQEGIADLLSRQKSKLAFATSIPMK